MTWTVACTPASVRPAPWTAWRVPPVRRASAASSSPWTVRAPTWIWKPANSVPSYSTVARNRRIPVPPRRALSGIAISDQLDLDDLRRVAGPGAKLHDAGVARGAVAVLRRDPVEQLRHDERLVRELRHDRAAGRQVAPLGERDRLLDAALDLLGLRLGGLHALIAQHRHRQVLVEREPRAHLAAELAA